MHPFVSQVKMLETPIVVAPSPLLALFYYSGIDLN